MVGYVCAGTLHSLLPNPQNYPPMQARLMLMSPLLMQVIYSIFEWMIYIYVCEEIKERKDYKRNRRERFDFEYIHSNIYM